MKRLMFLAAMLAALCGSAFAQTKVQDGNSTRTSQQAILVGGIQRSDSTGKVLTMSSTGGLAIYDEDRDRSNWRLVNNQAIIQRDTTEASTILADSSGTTPVNVSDLRHLMLLFKVNAVEHKAANFTNNVRLAVQIRVHVNGIDDSTSTFAYYPFGVGAAGVTTGAVAKGDTLTTGHISSGSATLPWSGEFVVNFDGARAAASGSDVLRWQFPNGICIPLDSILGRDFWAPYISVRVRIINTDCWKWFGSIYLMGSSL